MSADSEMLPPPNNPEVFESLCLELWREIWEDPTAQKNGRGGQPQTGVDVYGQQAGRWTGVQCKQKDGLLRSKLTVGELQREVGEALRFRPKLSTFILATTGPADPKIQKCARELTDEHRRHELFAVSVWSWREIWQELYRRSDLLRRLGPTIWPGLLVALAKKAPCVFISYSHDSPEHRARVLALANRLRSDGVDCLIDQYIVTPPEGWPRWMDRQIREADFVLLACTQTYFRRMTGDEQEGKGLGVRWEGGLILQHIYNAGFTNTKFIPILFRPDDRRNIPTSLQSTAFYTVDSDAGYEELYRRLTSQPRTAKPVLGKLRRLPDRKAKSEGTHGEVPFARESPPSSLAHSNGVGSLADREIDAEVAMALIAEARRPGGGSAIASMMAAELPKRADPTERYWIYTAFGEIGGAPAFEALAQATTDPDEFAREGASEALAILRTHSSSKLSERGRRWWWFPAMGFVALCGVTLLKLPGNHPNGQTATSIHAPSGRSRPSMGPNPRMDNGETDSHIFVIRKTSAGAYEILHVTPSGQQTSMQFPFAEPILIRLDKY